MKWHTPIPRRSFKRFIKAGFLTSGRHDVKPSQISPVAFLTFRSQLQWRDRIGFSPTSLLTQGNLEHLYNWYRIIFIYKYTTKQLFVDERRGLD